MKWTRHLLALLLVGALTTALALAARAEDKKDKDPEPKWVSLFNGNDLTGWKMHPDNKGNWKVEEGLLVGRGPANHLFSERGDYENFRYKVVASINDKGNSGQYFRAEFGPSWPKGFEAQINSTHGDPVRTGSLYGFKDCLVKEMLVKPDTWFTQEVIAVGNHIIIKVDGKETVNKTFEEGKLPYKKGHFALQQHNQGSEVKFKSIEVIELPPSK